MTTLQIGTTTPKPVLYRKLGIWALVWLVLFNINDPVWDGLLYRLMGLDENQRWVEVVHFFLADSFKIALLLVGITFLATMLRTFLTVERTQALLSGRRAGLGNFVAAGLGVLTPFCSCSAVPAFIGFISAGVPLAVTMSFLIASPLVNEIAVGLLAAWFGVKIAALYAVSGFAIAVISGLIFAQLRPEHWVEEFVLQSQGQQLRGRKPRLQDRIDFSVDEVRSIVRKVWPYLLAGISIGAILHGWAPTEFFATWASADRPYGVLVAVVVGIPLYSNAAGALPIVQVLAQQGLPMGTLLAFMMSVVGLSLPELILLRRVLKVRMLALFVSIVGSGIIVIGYMFNAVLG